MNTLRPFFLPLQNKSILFTWLNFFLPSLPRNSQGASYLMGVSADTWPPCWIDWYPLYIVTSCPGVSLDIVPTRDGYQTIRPPKIWNSYHRNIEITLFIRINHPKYWQKWLVLRVGIIIYPCLLQCMYDIDTSHYFPMLDERICCCFVYMWLARDSAGSRTKIQWYACVFAWSSPCDILLSLFQ